MTSRVLDCLKAAGLDKTSEIPVSEVAARLGYDRRAVQGAINGLRRRGVLPPASARKPRIDPGDWSRSSSWLWMLSPAPVILPAPTEAQLEEQSKQRREQVASYVREWKRLKRGVKPKPKPDPEPIVFVPPEPKLGEKTEEDMEYDVLHPTIAGRQRERATRPPAPAVKGLNWRSRDGRWFCDARYNTQRIWTAMYRPGDWRACIEEFKAKLIVTIKTRADLNKRINEIDRAVREWDREQNVDREAQQVSIEVRSVLEVDTSGLPVSQGT